MVETLEDELHAILDERDQELERMKQWVIENKYKKKRSRVIKLTTVQMKKLNTLIDKIIKFKGEVDKKQLDKEELVREAMLNLIKFRERMEKL